MRKMLISTIVLSSMLFLSLESNDRNEMSTTEATFEVTKEDSNYENGISRSKSEADLLDRLANEQKLSALLMKLDWIKIATVTISDSSSGLAVSVVLDINNDAYLYEANDVTNLLISNIDGLMKESIVILDDEGNLIA